MLFFTTVRLSFTSFPVILWGPAADTSVFTGRNLHADVDPGRSTCQQCVFRNAKMRFRCQGTVLIVFCLSDAQPSKNHCVQRVLHKVMTSGLSPPGFRRKYACHILLGFLVPSSQDRAGHVISFRENRLLYQTVAPLPRRLLSHPE